MKKIIPFSKDIVFNTNIEEINSISLEHNLKLVNDNELTGEFIISGDYKESNNVLNNEPFIYNIPFNIVLDNKYSSDNLKLDIDNFEYDLVSYNTININISISLDGIEEIKEEPVIEVIDEEPVFKEEPVKEEVTSVFDNFDDTDDTYVNYNVHIYREKDEINEIIKKYNTSKEELEEYNDLSNITLGSKIIIPGNE
ncbi:MAG: hypothetical protein IKF36_03210 [Bacilli bacterium]|nr:hypothetical protein [Bacilli bacterium]